MKNTSKEFVLNVDNISILFGGLKAVSEFSLELNKGELVGLIGPNGAGKTTVFNMLSGVYQPSMGNIIFNDKNGDSKVIGNRSPAQLCNMGISRTFQNIRLFQNISVADNVRIALHANKKSHIFDVLFRTKRFRKDEEETTKEVHRLLSLFRIENKENELAKNLPYGEQRKLEIVRALASNPSLLLLDEPAAGMNPKETAELMELISFIRKEFNVTIILIEHDMNLVMGVCERLVVLDYGKVIASGNPEEIRKNKTVIKAYLGTEAAA